MKLVIEIDEQYKNLFLEMATALKAKVTVEEKDFYEDLPEYVKEGIKQSREEIKQGKVKTNEEVMRKYIKGI